MLEFVSALFAMDTIPILRSLGPFALLPPGGYLTSNTENDARTCNLSR